MSRRCSLLATLAVMLALAVAAPALAGLHAGDLAPEFRGTDLDGVSHRLSESRGKVVVLFVLGST